MRLVYVILALAALLPVRSGTAQAAAATLTLRPGDAIEVFLWREEKLSGDFLVDEQGRATLPIIGTRMVTDAPWTSVRDSLMAAYARELRDPAVRITPKRRVFVLGFVTEPGAYFADPTVPIAGAIAMAGGASSEGDLTRVRVVRNGEEIIRRASVESPLVAADVQSGDQIFVDRRGWFDRNSPFFVSAMVGLAGIIVTLIIAQ